MAGAPIDCVTSVERAPHVTPEVGRLVPLEDPEALAGAIAEVVDARAAFPAERLRAHALAKFGWAQVTERTIDAWMRNGAVPFFKIGRRTVRFRLADLQNHLDAFCRVARRTQ